MNRLNFFGQRFLDPWRQLSGFENLARLLPASAVGATQQHPAVNVFASNDDLLLSMELPGIDPEKLDITVVRDTLTLRGERTADAVQAGEAYHRRERPAGSFARTVHLPFEVDATKTEATYDKGLLQVKLTRPESTRPKKVAVKAV